MKSRLLLASALAVLALVSISDAAEPDTRVLVDKAVKAAGGADKLPGYFTFRDRVLIGETDTGFGAKRESVLDAPRSWWLKKPGGYSQRDKEPATFIVWAWTLRALTDATSKVETLPAVKDGDTELWGLRVSGSITPPMDLFFARTNDLLARIDWRSDIHRFSNWKTTASGFTYPARVVGYKKATGKIWYFDDVTEVTPLKELPEKIQEMLSEAK